MHKRSSNNQRAGDPAHIGRPEEDISRLDVEMDQRVMRDLQRKATMRMDEPLGLARRARREEDHEGIVGCHRFAHGRGSPCQSKIIPIYGRSMIGLASIRRPQDQKFETGRGRCLNSNLFAIDPFAAPEKTSGRYQCTGAA